MKAAYQKYTLEFKIPGGTSRGILHNKDTFFLIIKENGKLGIGECSLFRGLSIDDRPDYENKLQWACYHIQLGKDQLYDQLRAYPSIQIGIETAFKSLESSNLFDLFPSKFTK